MQHKHADVFVVTGYGNHPNIKPGQEYARINVVLEANTYEVCYYAVLVFSEDRYYNFLTLEKAMIYCDLHDYYVDTTSWSNKNVGMHITWIFAPSSVNLENGQILKIGY